MSQETTHRVLNEWKSGCFRLVQCACGGRTLFTGGAVLRLDARHLKDLAEVLEKARGDREADEAGKKLTSNLPERMLSAFQSFNPKDGLSGECN